MEENKKLDAVEFERRGRKMIIPEGLSYEDALKALTLKMQEDEMVVSLNEEIDAYPMDGAYALMNVLKNRYGWASPVPTMTFFGPKPPQMRSLEIGCNKYTQVIWGEFEMPGIEGRIATGSTERNGRTIFAISGKVKRKHEKEVEQLADEVRVWVKKNSVYKGKAVRLRTDDVGDLDMYLPPTFLDTKSVREEELVLPTSIMDQVETNLFTPIRYTEACRRDRIPLKRSLALEGPFGTGKTLTAYVAAKLCEENGWTFIYLDRVSGLGSALQFAKMYEPAVIFAEDIDRVVSGQERTVKIDDVLNTIDGIESKNTEIMCILTSNDIASVNRAMIRPGRLDAIIGFRAPDAEAAQRLMRIYGRDKIASKEDLVEAGQEMDGCIPAVIREVVERAKLAAVARTKGNGVTQITGHDLALSAKGMKHHLELMKDPEEEEMTPEEKLGHGFGDLIRDVIHEENGGETLMDHASTTKSMTENILQKLRNM